MTFKFTNTIVDTLIDAGAAGRNYRNASDAFDARVAALYAAIGGKVDALPKAKPGKVQDPAWTKFKSTYLQGYMTPEEFGAWSKEKSATVKDRLGHAASQSLRRMLDGLKGLQGVGVAVGKADTAETIAAKAAAAKSKARGTRKPTRTLAERIADTMTDFLESVEKDRNADAPTLAGHAELRAALARVADLVKPAKPKGK
jgi:hypothetical protein